MITAKQVSTLVYLTMQRNLNIAREQGAAVDVVVNEEKHTLMKNKDLQDLLQACAANIAQALMGEQVR